MISIDIIKRPWGGNLFFENLKHYLESNNHHVNNHLYMKILMILLVIREKV